MARRTEPWDTPNSCCIALSPGNLCPGSYSLCSIRSRDDGRDLAIDVLGTPLVDGHEGNLGADLNLLNVRYM